METYNCIKIDYFPHEEYRPDPHDSTLAIPYTITKSAPFFLISAIFLLISSTIFLVATCSHQNCLYYFASGILFIVSGLLMLIGLIVYISIFKAEIGSKLRPKSTLQPPLFTFSYGPSFFLYVFGFVSTEFVGVLNIFLYISLQQVGHKTIPCLPFISAREKITDVETTSRQTLRPYNERTGGVFICNKHSGQSSNISYSDMEQRYYFEKPPKCDVHSKNIAKSLNELYTEPAPTFTSFHLPQEFPLTRSVSTTTEIFSNNNNATNNVSTIHNSKTSTLKQRNKKNQTNEGESSSKDSLNDICGFSRGILSKSRKSKDELFNEFCRKSGVRPKPKDIYYIEDNQTDREDESVFIVDNYPALTKDRQNSFTEPCRRNSNLSLRPLNKVYQKSLFDLERCESEQWKHNYADHYLNSKSNSRDMNIYSSRTLPRCFTKRNFEPHNSIERDHRYSLGLQGSKNFYSSENMLHKSCDDLNSLNYALRKPSNNLHVQWPTAIPTSPSSFSTKSTTRYSTDQTGYYSRHKFCRPQQYDEHNNHPGFYGTFDLDQIERERRKSHASLFELGMRYDAVNGTAV